jgi:hypothetical protein
MSSTYQIERNRGTKDSRQQLAALRKKWPLAFPAKPGPAVPRRRPWAHTGYPGLRPLPKMSFRIGITIGDIVERDGDLLGDGINIAARLEGLAPPGGLCVARTVYEQVSNKLSVKFADIGEQEVKNIATPVHAYTVMLSTADRGGAHRGIFGKARMAIWPIAIVSITAAVAFAISAYLSVLRTAQPVESAGVMPGQLPPVVAETPPVRRAERGPCGQITAACQAAGFTFRTQREGTGLQADCIVPIMQGTRDESAAPRAPALT